MSDSIVTNGNVSQVAFHVPDLAKAKGFYETTLGLSLAFEAKGMLFFDAHSVRLMISQAQEDQPESRGSILYFDSDNIEASHQQLVQSNVKVLRAPHLLHKTESSELWMCFFEDPFGNVLALTQQTAVG